MNTTDQEFARPGDADVILRRFDRPDEVREMTKGRFEIVRLGGVTVGRATYEPGWRWSEHPPASGHPAPHSA